MAALGSPFGPTDMRGVYKTADGGKTWTRTLFVNRETGARVLAINPANPNELYAGMYRAFRKGWDIISGGPASEGGIYKSTDGGDTWTKLAAGLPQRLIGKIDIDVARSKPSTVYAMIEAPERRGRPLPLGRCRRDVDEREQQPAPARAAVLLPLRRREPEERERSLGQRAEPVEVHRRRPHLRRRSTCRTATTTASGSTRTTPTTPSSRTTAAPRSRATAEGRGRRS